MGLLLPACINVDLNPHVQCSLISRSTILAMKSAACLQVRTLYQLIHFDASSFGDEHSLRDKQCHFCCEEDARFAQRQA